MPIYQYRCESCGSLWEEIRNLAQRDEPFACQQCDSQCTRNLFPAAPVALRGRQKERGSEGATAISIQGPTSGTIENNVFMNLNRGVVAHPQAQISIKKSRFHNVKVPVERRKK